MLGRSDQSRTGMLVKLHVEKAGAPQIPSRRITAVPLYAISHLLDANAIHGQRRTLSLQNKAERWKIVACGNLVAISANSQRVGRIQFSAYRIFVRPKVNGRPQHQANALITGEQ